MHIILCEYHLLHNTAEKAGMLSTLYVKRLYAMYYGGGGTIL